MILVDMNQITIASVMMHLNMNDNINAQYILENKLNYFKIELIENYGAAVSDKSKFCLNYIGLHGTKIDSVIDID